MITRVQIAALKDDCETLISSFISHESTEYKYFCSEWLRMNFHYIFHGYACDGELVQFIEDVMIVIKHKFLKETEELDQIGYFYLMYTVYFKQPTKEYCKFRVTLKDWKRITHIYNEWTAEHNQARLMFWKLLQANAFRFVEAEHDYGFELFMHKKHMRDYTGSSEYKKFKPTIFAKVKNESSGIIPALEILQVGYNEMKEHLDLAGPSQGLLPTSTFMTDIVDSINKIENNFKSIKNGEHKKDYKAEKEDEAIGLRRRDIKRKAFEDFQAKPSSVRAPQTKVKDVTEKRINQRKEVVNVMREDEEILQIKVIRNDIKNKHALEKHLLRSINRQLIVDDDNADENDKELAAELDDLI